MRGKIERCCNRIENATVMHSIRDGFVMTIPIVMVGCFALIFQYLPIPIYQDFFETYMGKIIYNILEYIHSCTTGAISVYLSFCIAYSISKKYFKDGKDSLGAPICSACTFLIAVGFLTETFNVKSLGTSSVFLAFVCSIGASYLYIWLYKKYNARKEYNFGAELHFIHAISSIIPMAVVIVGFSIFKYTICAITGANDCWELLEYIFAAPLKSMGENYISGITYVFLSNALWFFGINGSDVLEVLTGHSVLISTDSNALAVASGMAPTHIYTKALIDNFTLMGGCGTTLALMIAILLFSKNRESRAITKTAAIPMFFNVNEIMTFGLPIIYNPIMFIPFVFTPVITYSLTVAAMKLGLVPLITVSTNWTTPILIGGYISTGSIAGLIMQVVDLAVGVAIYAPFVKMMDKNKAEQKKNDMRNLVSIYSDA